MGGGVSYRFMSKAIQLPSEIGDGKDREFKCFWRTDGGIWCLFDFAVARCWRIHSARVPITIQAVAGAGTLRVGDEQHALLPGVIVPLDAHAVHNVQADPAVAILVTFFRRDEAPDENDTTARFD